jgi:hypothetical protein
MKKYFLMVVAAMMTTMSVKAENGYEYKKHEVALSYGAYSNSQILDFLENVSCVMAGSTLKNEKYVGPVTAEYFYHLNKWLGVGGIFSYGQNKQDVYSLGTKDGKDVFRYISLLPAVKFDWFRRKHYGLYSKIGLGATIRNEKYTNDTNPANNDSNTDAHVNWQVSVLGFEAGSSSLRGFVELGTGEQGIAVIGLRYKF